MNDREQYKQYLESEIEKAAEGGKPFTLIVLTEALRKINESDLTVNQIAEWLLRVEQAWRTIPK